MYKAITVVLLFISLVGNSQSRNNKISGVIRELQEFKIPLNFSKFIKEVEFNEQEKRLNQAEWNYLVVDKKMWLFQKGYYYYYDIYGKLNLSNNLTGIIYKRCFLPADINREKIEFVLATFSKGGRLISSLPIQGMYGDDISFSGIINHNYEITINREIFVINKTTNKSEVVKKANRYKLKPTGEIVKLL